MSTPTSPIWHPFTQHTLWDAEDFPVIERGEGVYLFDVDGRTLCDPIPISIPRRLRDALTAHILAGHGEIHLGAGALARGR